jgi:hypothetical protein
MPDHLTWKLLCPYLRKRQKEQDKAYVWCWWTCKWRYWYKQETSDLQVHQMKLLSAADIIHVTCLNWHVAMPAGLFPLTGWFVPQTAVTSSYDRQSDAGGSFVCERTLKGVPSRMISWNIFFLAPKGVSMKDDTVNRTFYPKALFCWDE